jgi:predicted GIY-YIG superfamily endonuclease
MREIYVLKDANGKVRYVGSSKNAKDRVRRHWQYRNSKNTPCAAWLRTLSERPCWYVVEIVEEDIGDAMEREWIAHFREVSGESLLNVTTGGRVYRRTAPRPPVSHETRAKIGASSKGRTVGENERRLKSARMKELWADGRFSSEETRRKKSESMRAAWAAKRARSTDG